MASKKNEKTLKLDVEVDISEAQKKFTEFQHDFKNKISSTIGEMKNRISTSVTNAIETVYKSLPRTEADEATRSLKKLESEYHKLVDKIKKNSYASSRTIQKNFKEEKTSIDGARKSYESLASTINGKLLKSYNELKRKISEVSTARIKDNKIQDNDKNNGIISAIPRKMASFTSYTIASRTITATINAVMSLARANIQLESSFANIQAIVSASDVEMGKLRNTILRVGEASKYSVEEIAKATTMLGQAGLTADEINNVLETTTQLAAGTGSELSNTVDLMTSALAVWGLNSEEASHLSDVMVTGMNRTKATLETFRMAVQYAGATMASLNVSFDEFASVAAAASNAGLRASVVGTGLRAMTSELISPTKKMVAGLAQLGLSTEDVNIESQGLVNVLYKLKNAGLTAANAYDLFGKRAAQFVLAAQGQLDVVDELEVAFAESGATLKAYNTQMNTVAAEWTALANTIKRAAYNILQQTDGFIHDMIVKLKNAIRGIFYDEFDEIAEEISKMDLNIESLKKYGDIAKERLLVGNFEEKDIARVNKMIESLNLVQGTNIKLAKSAEDVANKYKEIADEVERLTKLQYDERNAKTAVGIEGVKNEYLTEKLLDVNKDIAISSGSNWSISKVQEALKKDEGGTESYRSTFNSAFDKYFKLLSENADDYDKLMDDLLKKHDETIKDYRESMENARKRGDEKTAKYIYELEKNQDLFDSLVISALKGARDAVVNKGFKFKDYNHDKEVKKITDEVYKTIKDANELAAKGLSETSREVNDWTSDILDKEYKKVQSELNKAREEVKKLDGEKDKDRITKLNEEIAKAESALMDRFLNLTKKVLTFIKGKTQPNKEEINKLQDLLDKESGASPLDIAIREQKENEKDKRRDARSQREIEREKARQFNLKYQGLAIQQQADEYNAQIEQAKRKGVQSRYAELDKTGTIASAYSRYSTDKERLEKFKTAYNNQQTLDKYMKDYGDLFKQVESGQVSLEDADNKSDKLISKMIELKKSTEEAKAEFGDLNETNLDKVNEEISDLDDKMKQLDDDSKTVTGQMWIGFSDAITKMAQSYSAASIGKTIAEDLGNGMADALNSIVDGSKSIKDAFSDMARSILQDISKMLIRMAVLKAMEAAVGLMSGGGQVYDSPIGPTQTASSSGFFGMNKGGFIPKIRAAAGSMVRGGVQGKDSVPALLMPGEYVLKKSAVDALGTNFLNDLNNNAAQTLTNTAANMVQNPYQEESKSEPAVVNVWVVSKEEEAKMGPNDVIATISKDIMVGGQTRRLIQQVVAGRK